MKSGINIVLCLKQVPDTTDIKWSKENNIVREGLLSVLNPLDYYALECAANLKQNNSVYISALTMAPMQAKSILEFALAKCADSAILLNDGKFIGSDTLCTAKVLAAAIRAKIANFDLIICSQSAADGETAQTPPSLAQMLGVEYVANVKKINSFFENDCKILVEKEIEGAVAIVEVALPAVISVVNNCEVQILQPKIEDYILGAGKQIEILGAVDIKIDENFSGIKDSPTSVHRVYRPKIERKYQNVDADFGSFVLTLIDDVVKSG